VTKYVDYVPVTSSPLACDPTKQPSQQSKYIKTWGLARARLSHAGDSYNIFYLHMWTRFITSHVSGCYSLSGPGIGVFV